MKHIHAPDLSGVGKSGRPSQPDYAAYRDAIAGRPLPLALLDRDALDANIAEVRRRAGMLPVRVASKSVRSVPVLRRILSTNGFRGLMCMTVAEAVYLASQGFEDLLVAYPTVDPAALRLAARASQRHQLTIMVDCEDHVAAAEAAARAEGQRLKVCLDLDIATAIGPLRVGALRSPLRGPEAVVVLARRIRASPHLELEGVMGYEAQIAGVSDATPYHRVRNLAVRALKRLSVPAVARQRAAAVAALRAEGIELRFVNGGGTGSLTTTNRDPSVTEVTVGSAFYAPVLFDHQRAARFTPAAMFAIEVTRRPRPDVYTCLGGGYVASGPADPDKLPQPYLPAGAELLPLEGAGEVQTPIRYRGELRLGDPVFLRHAKAGELCERFTHLVVVSEGRVVDEVTTYRGDGRCFL
ncbi:amino acid aldolase [Rubrobacter xylanophilus]|uniref:Amino acid aldolase n=1 Tax=Rubrobacter xylanophilus TaxID=49319 RepID=A0A510HLF3_9ACTN|nr:amino acid aldolase [Rubrobacter xylanophilus]